ncbi:MoaD/ThiS family protein [Parasphingorhabdus cellanae]|uniref:MoaD/ThiS family protein n=1 Tax=Parasphingorhabdus cellanae TaxID=2806553 RepID=A0ABX7T7S8_9SPHN|nr:MoaD/ThiS family protein [Parasphingorhabdus cellanae]QTD56552.1 MoaD/ThiS family protein [Parasphingorhabdus cellanae]
MSHELNLVYFSWVKERIGREQESLNCPEDVETVGQLLEYLQGKDTAYQFVFADVTKLRFALDHDFVGPDASIGRAKELAVFPPVTGG